LTKKEKKKNKKDKKAKAMQESGGEPGDEVHINTGSLKGWLI
jgi:transcription antitermination factor NusG